MLQPRHNWQGGNPQPAGVAHLFKKALGAQGVAHVFSTPFPQRGIALSTYKAAALQISCIALLNSVCTPVCGYGAPPVACPWLPGGMPAPRQRRRYSLLFPQHNPWLGILSPQVSHNPENVFQGCATARLSHPYISSIHVIEGHSQLTKHLQQKGFPRPCAQPCLRGQAPARAGRARHDGRRCAAVSTAFPRKTHIRQLFFPHRFPHPSIQCFSPVHCTASRACLPLCREPRIPLREANRPAKFTRPWHQSRNQALQCKRHCPLRWHLL